MIKTSKNLLLVATAVLISAASAHADFTYVCDEKVTGSTPADKAQISLDVSDYQTAYESWTLTRRGQKFNGDKNRRILPNGYEIKVQGTGETGKAQMVYLFDEGKDMCYRPQERGSVKVTLVASGQSKVLETRSCTCHIRY